MRRLHASKSNRVPIWKLGLAFVASTFALSCDLFDSKKSKDPDPPPPPVPVVLVPSIAPTPAESTLTTPITVVVASATAGSWVCWTTDGSEPTDQGRCADTARIHLDSSAQVKARAYANGMSASGIASERYTILLPKLATPRLVPDSGFFDSAIAISIANMDSSYGSGWEFRYTTDGTEPTLHSARYQGAFRLGHNATVKARLWAPGRRPSDVVSGKFTFSRPFDLSGAPRISPRDTTFDTSVVVVIAPPQAGCDIRYTTDSTEPTQWSRQSFGQILLERSARVKAKAWCQDMYGNVLEPSATDSTDITIRYKPAIAPVFNPEGGTYDSVQYVALTSPTSGATIRYTIDGREPTLSSSIYRGPITLRSTATIKAMAFAPDRPSSDVVSATFTLRNVPTSGKPVISGAKEASSSWSGDTVIRVSIKAPDLAGTVVRYTLDGATPSESSPVYRESFVIDGARTVKARSFRRGMLESAIDSQRFEPRLSRALAPTFSPDTTKYSADSVQYIYLSTRTPGCQIRYTLDGKAPTASSTYYNGNPITLSKTTTVKAIALAFNRETSPVASATWTLKPLSAAAVKISTTAKADSTKVYKTLVPLSMTTTTPDAVIRYTLDGTAPQETSPVYSGPLTLEASDTVKARAFRRGLLPGPVATFAAVIRLVPCDSVVISDSLSGPGGYRTVRMSSRTDSAQIWYGYGEGTATPYLYQSPFLLSSTTKIHAVARKYGRAQSKLSAREIKVTLPAVPKPRISPRDTTAKDVVRVSIADSLSGATIWYSRYGYDRTRYTGAFDVEDSVTKIIAWAEASGYVRSANDTVTIKVTLPSAGKVRHKLAQGIYGSVQYDTIVADSSSATVWVSVDSGAFVAYGNGRAVVRLDHYARVRAYATLPHRLRGPIATAWYDIRLPKASKPEISPRGGYSDTVVKATITTTEGLSTWYRIGYGSAYSYKKGQVLTFSSNTVLTAWNTGADQLQSDVDSVSWSIQLRPVDTLLADKSAGYYDTGLVVNLSTATKGATIWVRLDPVNGNSGTGVLRQLDSTGRLRIDSSAILYAYATAEGRAASSAIRIRYDVRRYTAPIPVRKDTLGGLVLSSTLGGAQVLYQVNAGGVRIAPTSSPLPLAAGTYVVTSWTAKPGWQSSPLRVDTIRVVPATPTISPNGGTIVSGSVVYVRSPNGLPVRYTLNGKIPTQTSLLWSRDLVLADSLFGKADTLVLTARVWADSIPSAAVRAVFRRMVRVAPVVASIPDTAKLDTGAVVILRTATKGATVWWRLKGVGDYRGSTDSVRIALDSTMSVEAYASKADMQSSAVSTFSWKVPRYGVATPSISPRSGTIKDSASVQVSIKTATPNAQIFYMINAAGPYAYAEPFRIQKTSVITAYATRPGWNRSALDSVNIVFGTDTVVAAPKFSPSSGAIAAGTKVAITGPSGATIRYTLDGSAPNGESPVYETPISINVDSVVLKARAWVGSRTSVVATARYTLATSAQFNVWMKPHGGTFTDSVAVAITCAGCSDTTLLLSSFGKDSAEALANGKAQSPLEPMKIRSSGKAWLLLVGARSKTLLSWDSASFTITKSQPKAGLPVLMRDTATLKDGNIIQFADSIRIRTTPGQGGDQVMYKDMCVEGAPVTASTGSVKFTNVGTCVVKFWSTNDGIWSDTVRITLSGYRSALTAPIFSPASGTIRQGTYVTISGPAGASIEYSLDAPGGEQVWYAYTTPIAINVDNAVVSARAKVDGRTSQTAIARYTFASAKPGIPVVRLDTGAALKSIAYVDFYDSLWINATASGSGEQLWYTNNCDLNSSKGIATKGRFVVRDMGSCMINVYSTNATASSDTFRLISRGLKGAIAPPVFKPAGGIYLDSVRVTLAHPNNGRILYSVSGGTMVEYTSPFLVSKTASVVARAYVGTDASVDVKASYTITNDPSELGGRITDTRDGKVYKTVTIGSQTWFAENLALVVDSSNVYDNNADSGAKYGRLYKWSALMNLPDSICSKSMCTDRIQPQHQGICPEGWHVPTDAEWATLVAYAGGPDSAAKYLKSTSGWAKSGNGVDAYGFSGLPGGLWNGTDRYFGYSPQTGYWWTATSQSTTYGYVRSMGNSYPGVSQSTSDKQLHRFSGRCVKN